MALNVTLRFVVDQCHVFLKKAMDFHEENALLEIKKIGSE